VWRTCCSTQPDRRVAVFNTYIMAVAPAIRIPVAFTKGGVGDAVTEVCSAFAWTLGSRFISGICLKASVHPIEEERREHVKTVYIGCLRLLAPVIVMSSEMSWCWLKAYLESEEEGRLMTVDMKCNGIYYGTDSLLILIFYSGLWPFVTVNAKSTLTLENMCKFQLSMIEVGPGWCDRCL